MKILHIAKIDNNKSSGVNVVVPQRILVQSKKENVYFLNLNDCIIDELKGLQLEYKINNQTIYNVCKTIGKIDIVVIHEVNNVENIKIYKQLLKMNIPYIIVPHGEITESALSQKKIKKKVAYLLFFNKFILNAKGIQCLSKEELNTIKIKIPNKIIIGNGVNIPIIKKKQFNENEINITYIGRLDPHHKGLDSLIESVSKIKNKLHKENVSINLYGPYIEDYNKQLNDLLIKFNLNNFIKIHNSVFAKEKEKVLLESDLFIQTSRHEGLPTGILEAMGIGLPCIITKGTNMADILQKYDAGYYAGNTIDSIRDAIIKSIDDKMNWPQKGENGIKLVEENFTWDLIIQKELNYYRSIVDNYE